MVESEKGVKMNCEIIFFCWFEVDILVFCKIIIIWDSSEFDFCSGEILCVCCNEDGVFFCNILVKFVMLIILDVLIECYVE